MSYSLLDSKGGTNGKKITIELAIRWNSYTKIYKRVPLPYISSESFQRRLVVEYLFDSIKFKLGSWMTCFGLSLGVYVRSGGLVSKGYVQSVIQACLLRRVKELLSVKVTWGLQWELLTVKCRVLFICFWWDEENIHSFCLCCFPIG